MVQTSQDQLPFPSQPAPISEGERGFVLADPELNAEWQARQAMLDKNAGRIGSIATSEVDNATQKKNAAAAVAKHQKDTVKQALDPRYG